MSANPGFNSTLMDHEVRLSANAAAQMAQIVSAAEDNVEGIRVFVSGGGCGGMTYGMTYAESALPTDKIYEGEGFKMLVDVVALGYLKGCDIDYVEQGLNASFVFNNVFQSVGGSGACGGCGGGGGCA
ncbi:MAG: iron-sulfur cluster assembly accessory protein [Gammaproteobacteria bacterium]|nr:iron-sulfur cluster assembly accessory protein [Gammaproteobacteria bacterium]MDH5659409.1 iron-sulfur cluster assembly accessory protein [Gammaproteobacteria bacterium]